MSEDLQAKIEAALDSVRPMLMADGGDVELIKVEDGIVKLKLQGACGSCPLSQLTLRMGIERELKRQVPEVKEVLAI